MYLATSVMAAGGDSLRMTMNVFVMACLSFPDAFRRARQEIDRVCGSDPGQYRLPALADVEATPYLCAFVKEVLRWRPVVPLSPPHQLTEDLEFEGYTFRKGKPLFLINTLAVCNDCDDPDRFWPERWLDGNPENVHAEFLGVWEGDGEFALVTALPSRRCSCLISRLIYCFDFSAVTKQISWCISACPQALLDRYSYKDGLL